MRKMRSRVAASALWLCLSASAPCQDHPESPGSTRAEIPAEQRVDINHASLDELLKLPGMTPSWAGRVVRFRPYRSKQDLLDKGIVNSQVYDHIRQSIIAHRVKQ